MRRVGRPSRHERRAGRELEAKRGRTGREQLWSTCWREVCARVDPGSVILLQIHAVVQAGYLIAITIKHERGALEDFTEAAFLGLGPARVVDRWIFVGVKTVFAGVEVHPHRLGLACSV